MNVKIYGIFIFGLLVGTFLLGTFLQQKDQINLEKYKTCMDLQTDKSVCINWLGN